MYPALAGPLPDLFINNRFEFLFLNRRDDAVRVIAGDQRRRIVTGYLAQQGQHLLRLRYALEPQVVSSASRLARQVERLVLLARLDVEQVHLLGGDATKDARKLSNLYVVRVVEARRALALAPAGR